MNQDEKDKFFERWERWQQARREHGYEYESSSEGRRSTKVIGSAAKELMRALDQLQKGNLANCVQCNKEIIVTDDKLCFHCLCTKSEGK